MAFEPRDAGCLGRSGSSILIVRAPVAQLDRAPDFESVGRRFKSCRARHGRIADFGLWIADSIAPALGRIRNPKSAIQVVHPGPVAQLAEQQTLNL
jgi:hypothetical protein